MIAANLHLRWAELLVESLAASGVRDVVVSPGSRSTPVALAAAGSARLTVTVVLDERVAGFVALGQARVTGRASMLLCTSGSAGTHYFPAVVEAAAADLPMLVVTADRPTELQERAAAQTMAQTGLFGSHARAFFELGSPQGTAGALRGLVDLAAVAVARTRDPRPGPVHINARFAKPLEPQPDDEADARLGELVAGALRPGPPSFAAPRRVPDARVLHDLARTLGGNARGVILAGPGPLAQAALAGGVQALSERLGFPVLAEATSQLRLAATRPAGAIDFLELLAPGSQVLSDAAPEVVLQLGRPIVSGPWARWLERRPSCTRVVLALHGWNDPFGAATHVVPGDLEASLAGLLDALGAGSSAGSAWLSRWQRADEACRAAAAALAEAEEARGELSEAGVARELLPMTTGSLLQVGNSLAVREVDLLPGGLARGVGVLSQRGLSGIDGTLAGAAGAAMTARAPLAVLLGDLAFQHDLSALAVAARVGSPLVIVVLANSGGRLFELLPIAGSGVDPGVLRDLFVTPQELDMVSAARAFGVAAQGVDSHAELRSALAEAYHRNAASVIVARISGPGPRQRRLDLAARAAASPGGPLA